MADLTLEDDRLLLADGKGIPCDDGDVAESDAGAYALDPGGTHVDGASLESDSNDFMVLEHRAVTHRMLQ